MKRSKKYNVKQTTSTTSTAASTTTTTNNNNNNQNNNGRFSIRRLNNSNYLCINCCDASSGENYSNQEELEALNNDASNNKKHANNKKEDEETTSPTRKDVQLMDDLILDSLSLKAESTANVAVAKCTDAGLNYSPSDYNFLKGKYTNGLIRVKDSNRIVLNSEGSQYFNFKFDKIDESGQRNLDEQLYDVPRFISSVWRLKSPQIIIPIITGINFKNWKNRKLEEQFRRGIVKAARKTEMWLLTNGFNCGLASMIGTAFNEEKASRNTEIQNELNYLNISDRDSSPLTLMGIVSASSLQNWSSFDGNPSVISLLGNKSDGKNYKFDINPDHTHFLIYDDCQTSSAAAASESDPDGSMSYDTFRDRVEALFTRSLTYYKNKTPKNCDENDPSKTNADCRQIPLVCLTLRGDLKSIDAIELKIKKEIPVIILKGSGSVCDLISFAYDEMSENKDPDYEDNFIRPELNKRLLDEFKAELNGSDVIRNQYREKILSIVKNGSKGSQKFLTIVDMKGLGFNFDDLDKYILTALLQSQTQLSDKQGKAQLERNLRLTLDWNCPELALSEIFQRDDYKQIEIKNSIFDLAILRANREEFVELFLDEGFYLHKYLGRNNIRELFTKARDREFFVTVVLQGILGHFTNELPENFLPEGLNEVLRELTSRDNMINILEIYMNQLGLYVIDAKHAEKKALNFLIIFAVLFNRHKLAKILWKRTEDPIAVALICSLIYKNLLRFCQENYLKSQIEKNLKDFANAAIGVLDTSFQENDPRSYSVLTQKYPDWNDCNLLELAYNAKNLDFIAHPCCQKILTKRLFGSIQIIDTDSGFFDMPAWVKVVLSASLILPMYYWIAFPIYEVEKKSKKQNKTAHTEQKAEDVATEDKDDEDDEENNGEDTKAELNKKLITEIKKTRKRSQLLLGKESMQISEAAKSLVNDLDLSNEKSKSNGIVFKKQTKYVTPPFYEKVYLLWSSPFTKFWAYFISYMCFLFLFAIVTLWPCCGNLILDSVLWLWTATIAIEDTRVAYKNFLTGSQLPMTARILEIIVMLTFLVLFFFVRIVSSWDDFNLFGFDRIFLSKAVLCIFMLYFYYRTLFMFLPISHQLGPMLVRMKLMVKHDFMTYLRLFIISMTAGSMALNAILYPFHPLNWDLLKKVILFRGFLQLFVADKIDLERPTDECVKSRLHSKIQGPYSCVNLTTGIDFQYKEEKLEDYGVSYKCNHISVLAWVILIQYFLLVKLFLPTLLTALFSATGTLISAKSLQLWMYQRYEIILDYEKRLVFPPPFTVIVYAFMIIRWIVAKVGSFFARCRTCCRRCCARHAKPGQDQTDNMLKRHTSDPAGLSSYQTVNNYSYWSYIAKNYASGVEQSNADKSYQKQVDTNLNRLREDLSTQKKSLQRLNDRVISMEKKIILNQSYLEQVKNLLSQKTSKSGLLDRKKKNYVHILSRESPYVCTNIVRFFVYEKLVPWDCPYDLYDPPVIVFAVETYTVDKIFIDDEVNQKLKEEIQPVYAKQTSGLPPPPLLPEAIKAAPSETKLTTTDSQNATTNAAAAGSIPNTPRLERADSTKRDQSSSLQSLNQKKENVFVWNGVVTIDNPSQPGKKIVIDRRSWITRINEQTSQLEPVTYCLDKIGYPKNPIGRTGARGRGCLNRYGPNHEIMIIVTRWKKQKNKPIYVERRKLLEFVAVKDPITGLTNIPGDTILGDETQYSVVCRTFMQLVFEEQQVERSANFDEEDMMTFFASFASKTPLTQTYDKTNKAQLNDALNELGFIATMIYRGYIDDPRNTDNSWVEAEIWNFHYDKDDIFEKKIKNPESKWREVSSNVRINSNEIVADALKEIAEIHNAFYS